MKDLAEHKTCSLSLRFANKIVPFIVIYLPTLLHFYKIVILSTNIKKVLRLSLRLVVHLKKISRLKENLKRVSVCEKILCQYLELIIG